MHIVIGIDQSYSPDVELDENGNVVFARSIDMGETIAVPIHMLKHIRYKPMRLSFDTET